MGICHNAHNKLNPKGDKMANVEIKKTMVAPIEWLTNVLDEDALNEFIEKFGVKSSRTSSGEPRESVKLFDSEGNVIGRRDSILKLWFAGECYNGDIAKMSITRMTNKVKAHNIHEGKKLELAARELLAEAKTLEDPAEKLVKFEEYDAAIEEATKVKTAPITIDDVDLDDCVGYETAEELAKAMGVECITTAPKSDED